MTNIYRLITYLILDWSGPKEAKGMGVMEGGSPLNICNQPINLSTGKKYNKIMKGVVKTIQFLLNFIPRVWKICFYEMIPNFQLQKEATSPRQRLINLWSYCCESSLRQILKLLLKGLDHFLMTNTGSFVSKDNDVRVIKSHASGYKSNVSAPNTAWTIINNIFFIP